MILSIEKLSYLWKTKSKTFTENRELCERVDSVYKIVGEWEANRDVINELRLLRSPEDEDIPTDNWKKVEKKLLVAYDDNEQLKFHRSHVKEVEDLLHIVDRRQNFRISSNADSGSSYETVTTTVGMRNPESHYASYNYPFQIIQFFLRIKQSIVDPPPLNSCSDEKFIRKFLWMLADRNEVVPILSLASSYALSSIFLSIERNVDWGGIGSWKLPMRDFVEPWKRVSEALSQKVTDKKYVDLSRDEKMDFTKLLFIASITETTAKNALDMLRTGHRAMILYGPPGTGKTYTAKEVIQQLLGTSDPSQLDDCKFDKLFGEPNSDLSQLGAISQPGCWGLIQFHPTYSYHDFIGGIMPKLASDGELGYVMKKGIFTRFCDAASLNKDKPFVLIIDEINRADLSSVFGELMYAIEYRNEEVSIPHFPRFSIPKNVYIIGTMNSTDKSLVVFDLALRRRFLFL